MLSLRGHAAWRTRARRSWKPARPYMVRFSIFSRLIWPSAGLVVQGRSRAACTAARHMAVADSGWVTMVMRSGMGRTCTTARPAGIRGKRRLDKLSFQKGSMFELCRRMGDG